MFHHWLVITLACVGSVRPQCTKCRGSEDVQRMGPPLNYDSHQYSNSDLPSSQDLHGPYLRQDGHGTQNNDGQMSNKYINTTPLMLKLMGSRNEFYNRNKYKLVSLPEGCGRHYRVISVPPEPFSEYILEYGTVNQPTYGFTGNYHQTRKYPLFKPSDARRNSVTNHRFSPRDSRPVQSLPEAGEESILVYFDGIANNQYQTRKSPRITLSDNRSRGQKIIRASPEDFRITSVQFIPEEGDKGLLANKIPDLSIRL